MRGRQGKQSMTRSNPTVVGETFIPELRAVRQLSRNKFEVVTWGGYRLVVTANVLISLTRFATAVLQKHGVVFARWRANPWRWHIADAMAKAEGSNGVA